MGQPGNPGNIGGSGGGEGQGGGPPRRRRRRRRGGGGGGGGGGNMPPQGGERAGKRRKRGRRRRWISAPASPRGAPPGRSSPAGRRGRRRWPALRGAHSPRARHPPGPARRARVPARGGLGLQPRAHRPARAAGADRQACCSRRASRSQGMAVPTHPGQGPWLAAVGTINGADLEGWARHTPFKNLVAEDPTERIRLELEAGELSTRVVDLIAPIGKGQRCLIVAPAQGGEDRPPPEDRALDHREPSRDPPHRAARRRASRGGHRHAPHRARRGDRLVLGRAGAQPRAGRRDRARAGQAPGGVRARRRRAARFDHAPVARLQHRAARLGARAVGRDRRAHDGEAAALLRRRAQGRATAAR